MVAKPLARAGWVLSVTAIARAPTAAGRKVPHRCLGRCGKQHPPVPGCMESRSVSVGEELRPAARRCVRTSLCGLNKRLPTLYEARGRGQLRSHGRERGTGSPDR